MTTRARLNSGYTVVGIVAVVVVAVALFVVAVAVVASNSVDR